MMAMNSSAVRERFNGDHHRPRFHFLPPSNWMNDPNGVIQWNGHYHLFYQYNPFDSVWGNMHWGHAVSADLVHWQDLPIAVSPTPGGPDETGVFSGCAVVHDGVPTIVYTGVSGECCDNQTQNIAISRDPDLISWEKYTGNPVLSEVPPITGQKQNFRDPFVWRESDGWYMLVASELRGTGGVLFLYRSQNLIDWEYLHPFMTGDKAINGVIWECPNFFPIGDEWVLIISAHTGHDTGCVFYFIGSYENHHFTPRHEGVLDYAAMYAPLSMQDDQGRRVLFGWIRETRPPHEMRKAGWSGAQSIPRVLGVDAKHRLVMHPVPEIERIRGAHHRPYGEAQPLDSEITLPVSGLHFDITAEVTLGADATCTLSVAVSADGRERTDIIYDAAQQYLTVQTRVPSVGAMQITQARSIPHTLDPEEPLSLRVLLDGSVLEVIANQRTSLTHRMYPTTASSNGLRLAGSRATLRALDLWEMPSIWQ